MRFDFPSLGLVVGDRLEPTKEHWDLAMIDVRNELPSGGLQLLFWRDSEETVTRHRDPLFGESTRLTPNHMLIDTLHCLYLGVFQSFLSHLIRALGKGNCFGGPSYYGDVAIFEFTVKKCKEGLLEWYRKTEAEMVGARLIKIGDLTLKMLGTANRPEVALKGVETKWCLFNYNIC